MRQTKPQTSIQPISQELTKFFNLLHRDHSTQPPHTESQSVFGRKLSVIMSTSQHDSSQMEGTSLNGTGVGRDARKSGVIEAIRKVVQELLRSELAPVQVQLMKMLEGLIDELHEQHQHRIGQFLAYNHPSQSTLRQQPHKTKATQQAASHTHQTPIKDAFQLIQIQQKLTQLQSDNTFLKTLIVLANESYQSLEKKLLTLELQRKGSVASTNHRTKSKISIDDMGSCNERSRSPRIRKHVALPKAEEVYRKMVKRVLRQGNHSHTIK